MSAATARRGLLVELLARARERHSAGMALEQGQPEFGLELGDDFRERWLREMEPLGGASDVPLFGDNDEVVQTSSLDRQHRSLCYIRDGLELRTGSIVDIRPAVADAGWPTAADAGAARLRPEAALARAGGCKPGASSGRAPIGPAVRAQALAQAQRDHSGWLPDTLPRRPSP